jgi:hypothetical protein
MSCELIEGNVFRTVDRLRNRTVDEALRRRLHREVIVWRECLGADEAVGWRRRIAFERFQSVSA